MEYVLTHVLLSLAPIMRRTEYAKNWKIGFRELKKSIIVTEDENSLLIKVVPEEREAIFALVDSGLEVEQILESVDDESTKAGN